ncbi:uncharacterized protein LOC133496756 isoform X2 [Syngnathoides biaculeatus]|uniref:uncharacterized protein LOC133496756 isoform X2 n=1 Tax=Syngnathoides biaculeatus TaxID=300417 RepID=UPI002ADDE88B|nr:uncharacterized protein LOC133496756 isoform X2 [Syngnathoides biaculeatus]
MRLSPLFFFKEKTETIVQGSMSLKTQLERPVLSPKKTKIDNAVTNNNTSPYDLLEAFTSQTIDSPSLSSPTDADLIYSEQNGHIPPTTPCEQIQNSELTVRPQAEVTISKIPEVSVTTEESHFLHIRQYDQLYNLCPSPLSASLTLKDSTADMSGHPKGQLLEKTLEDKAPADCCVFLKNGMSNDPAVRYQFDLSCDSDRHDAVSSTWTQSAVFDESNQRVEDFLDTISQKRVKEHEGVTSFFSFTEEFQLLVSPPDEDIPIMLLEDKRILEMCDSSVACDLETNDHGNEGRSNISSPVQCAEVSLKAYHATPGKFFLTDTGSFDNLGHAKREHFEKAVKKEKERVDHSPENDMSVRISKESAEIDNDADPYRVIELGIWSKTVRETEGNYCNSESTAGEELLPSVKVCELEIPLSTTSDVRPLLLTLDQTVLSLNQNRPLQHGDEKENFNELYSVPSILTHNTCGYEGRCLPTSNANISSQKTTNPLPTVDEREQICGSLEQSSCLAVTCDQLKAQHVKHLPPRTCIMDEPKETKQLTGQIKSEMLLQQNGPNNEDMTEEQLVECMTEDTKLTPGDESKHGITDCSFPKYQKTVEILEYKYELLSVCFRSVRDAVVPGPQELSPTHHSRNMDCNMAQNWIDRFSSVPSASAMYTRVPGSFDNFHKIQLSPDYDEAGQGNCCLLTSLDVELMKSTQMDHSMLKAEDEQDDMPKEMEEDQVSEEGVKVECHTEDLASGGINTDTQSIKHVSGEDIVALQFSNDATGNNSTPPDSMRCLEFEMKKEFDLVLKELNVYFDICKREFTCNNGTPPEQHSEVPWNEVCKTSYLSSPELALHREPTLDLDEDCSTEICGTDPETCQITCRGGEQEVPIGCHMSSKASHLVAEKRKELQQTDLKRTAWSPSFRCLPLMQPQSNTSLWEPKRLPPLRTCTRPIRLGLSKKAKPKSLHNFHPYK